MRSNLRGPIIAFAASLALVTPAYAEINGNEAELLAIIGSTREYNGVLYQVSPQYQRAARAYLDDPSIDCTDEQKQKAINQMFGSIQQGIDEGYLIPVNQGAASGITSGSSSDVGTEQEGAPAEASVQETGGTGSQPVSETVAEGDAAQPADGSPVLQQEEAQTSGAEETQEVIPTETAPSPIVLALEDAMNAPLERSGAMAEGSLIPATIYPTHIAKGISLFAAALTVLCGAAGAVFGLFHHHHKKNRQA